MDKIKIACEESDLVVWPVPSDKVNVKPNESVSEAGALGEQLEHEAGPELRLGPAVRLAA